MEEERGDTFNDLTEDDIKSYMEHKEYDNVIKLTKNIYENDMINNDVFLKARYSCLIEKNEYEKIIYEIMHCLIKLDKKKNRKNGNSNFKKIFQENYKQIQNKNVLFELFYSMYKLRKFKKLYGCLKYFIENEKKYQDFIDMLYAQVNIILHKYNNSIHYFELLLNNKSRQTTAHVNLNSSYFSQFMKFMYAYNLLRRSKKEKANKNNNNDKLDSIDDYQNDDENSIESFYIDGERFDTNDIEELKNQIIKSTKNFNYEQNQNFEEIFNYTTFFIMEKNYSEAMKFIDVLEDMCLNIESDNDINYNEDDSVNEDTQDINNNNNINSNNNNNINNNNINNNNNNDNFDLNISFCRKEIFVQLQKAYIYSKLKKMNESIRIYERILNQYDNVKNNKIVTLIAYNNYIALMHNDNQHKLDIKQNKNAQEEYALTFHISAEKLSQIKNFLFTNNAMDIQVQTNNSNNNNNNNNNNCSSNNNNNCSSNNNYFMNITTQSNSIFNNMNQFIFSTISFNECISYLESEQKDEFKMKLKYFSTRFSNSVLLDKLIILQLRNKNYMKCKSYIYNRINLMNSFENQIKFINAYIYLCYEKKNFKEIVKIYLMYEHLFQTNIKYYSSFFTNLFYIYICCTDYNKEQEQSHPNVLGGEKTNKQKEQICDNNNNNISNSTNNLYLVLDLFYKYKENIQENTQLINYDTLYLVCKYLLYHDKEQLVQELFDYLCEHENNNLQFIACYTYLYTYMNVSNAYTYENKLKKLVLTETYLIDVEELENTELPFDKLNINNNASNINDIHVEKKKNKKKRKRSKKKKLTDPNSANLNPDRWLPKHEKPGFKKLKKKKKKNETPKQKVVVEVEETKTTLKQNKLQNLKKRRKK
ncbi:signal recognition particle subunit SRP72, putative [Plasmodium gaboni]|uniref:Signal recognition particle subunit SRP72, putative n=1 Tax=Plasmodium gaboni TaxID=647221 RepID=A0ABY1UPC6_9APIC|nr:signal recognition particle subunit SRP72, putative [Plasmodium gaboni]